MKINSSTPRKLIAVLMSLASLLAMGACDRSDSSVATLRKPVEATKTAGASAASAGTQMTVSAAAEVATPTAYQPGADDALIAAKVTTGLAADKNLSALRIKVEARDGVVTLRGPAPSAAARARAEEIARNVQGVSSVNNQLNVQPG